MATKEELLKLNVLMLKDICRKVLDMATTARWINEHEDLPIKSLRNYFRIDIKKYKIKGANYETNR